MKAKGVVLCNDKNFNAENPNEKKSIEYYITYRVNIKNTSLQSTTPLAFITYYDKDLEPIKAYKVIDGQEGDALELSVDDTFKPITNVPEGYKTVSYLTGSEALTSNSEDYIAEIQFRVKGNENESAEDVFRRLLNTNRYVENVSEIWDTHFYSEITGYYTEESYLDADSRPGNFDVAVFNERLEDYKKATYDYENNPTQELDTKLTLALDKIIEAREDDAWHVELDIADNEYRRTISGNVWEAINDEVKSALALQQQGYGNDTKEPLIFGQEIEGIDISKLNLANIKVELIEMEPDNESGETGTQRVRAVTRTAEDGSYLFKQYLPGKYTVRFTYGEENADGTVARSNVSVGDAVRQKKGEEFTPDPTDYLLLNGQYYQSTLANPDTNADVYWYKDKNLVDEETGKLEDMEEAPKRYSDAYDDAYSRLTQMNSVIDVSPDFEDKTPNSKEPETSSSFTYQGNWEVEDGKHNDRMYAYTSTIDIRIEYIRDKVQGSKTNKWYKYGIDNIDFGITPRVSNNVELYKNLSEFTITLNEAGKYVKQKYEIVEEDGERKIREKGAPEGDASILIKPVDYDNIAYRDGYIDVEMEQLLMQYANMEMTFEFKLKNNSERDDRGTNNPDDDIVEKLTYMKETRL